MGIVVDRVARMGGAGIVKTVGVFFGVGATVGEDVFAVRMSGGVLDIGAYAGVIV